MAADAVSFVNDYSTKNGAQNRSFLALLTARLHAMLLGSLALLGALCCSLALFGGFATLCIPQCFLALVDAF